ncbi:MAG TPA: DHA2 family efflux MFS transporter permease subunit [Burkholderiales bacterium]|nr:DHA2 family efflux MFS transporter permease subunit [Burkholderiales bacterium]
MATVALPSIAPAAEHRTPVLLTLLLSAANFMQVLDLTIANVSLPAITGDLGAAVDQGAWIITSYAVANAITVPLTGWLADRYGQARMFCIATALFTFASFLCGLSWTLPMLITARVLQGAMAGFMVPLSQALLIGNYPPEKRGMGLAIWSMTTTVAPIVGPLLGGWITDNAHWSWIFFINVPTGIIAAFGTWQLLKDRETPLRQRPLDRVGMALIVIWVGCLQVLLDKGNELDWFNSKFIVILAVVVVVSFSVFLVWELTDRHPIVDLELFRHRNFGMSVLALSLTYGLYLGTMVILSLWLQTQMGYTAQWAGYALAPVGVFAIILAPIVGRNLQRTDPRKFATAAFIIFAFCFFWRAGFTTGADFATIALPQLFQGVAVAMFFAPLVIINVGGIAPDRMASATSTQNFLRTMCGSFGTSLAIALWTRRQSVHHVQLAEHISIYSPQTTIYSQHLAAAGMPPDQVHAVLGRLLSGQANMLATNDIFWLAACLLIALIPVIWLSRPPFGRPSVAAAVE